MTRRAFRVILAIAGLLLATPAPLLYGQSQEVHELDANPSPPLGKRVIVRGRLQSAGGGRLHLVGSPIEFRYSETRLPIRPQTTHLEVAGVLAREQGKLLVRVDALEPIPGEAEEFAVREKKIPADNYAALYELSRWARARAKWYDDAELRDLASQSYRTAFAREEAAFARPNDIAGLLELANRGAKLGLEAREVQRIRYRALLLKQSRLAPGDLTSIQALANEVRELLPATDVPNAADAMADQRPPLNQRLQTYAEADDAARGTLHRKLWGDLVENEFDQRANDPTKLLELAREAEKVLPERADLANRLELAGWRHQAAHPERLERPALLAARAGLTRLEQPQEAQSLVEHWLRQRREKLPDDEAEDRIQLADDYLELVDDRRHAADLYREALAIVPDFAAAEAGLRRLGYEKLGNDWRDTRSLATGGSRGGANEDFIRLGASEDELVRRLRRPDRVTRTANRRGIFEQWIYDGPPSMVIYLRRNTTGSRATVTRLASSGDEQ